MVQVGGEDLSERASDADIADFCRKNDCDLPTHDMKAFEGFFEAGMNTIKITNYNWWNKKYILLIEIGS